MQDDRIPSQPKKRGRQPVDLRGRQYGWLVPLNPVPREPGMKGQTLWECVCTATHLPMDNRDRIVRVRYSALVEGKQRSCGCRQRTLRLFNDAGNRLIWTDCELSRNDFIGFGVDPAPEWAKTREEIEGKVVRQYTEDDCQRIGEELGIPDFDVIRPQDHDTD